jgi:hypothetical protein
MFRVMTTTRRSLVRRSLPTLLVAAIGLAACGSDTPNQPSPNPQPNPQPQPNNQPPVIDSIAVSTERTEADTDVTVTAVVRDAETPVNQLTFNWSADIGAFAGSGPSVTWRVPKGGETPTNQALRLSVVETYGTATGGGARPQHSVAGTSPVVRVHDSPKELGELAMRFLTDFANSSVPADTAVREFSDTCQGKRDERNDIEDNRNDFEVLSSRLTLSNAQVMVPWSEGRMTVRCEFSSRVKRCPPGSPSSCRVGNIDRVEGDCNMTAIYEQQRWMLCTSTFAGRLLPVMRGFFGHDR